jgi:hypothetical protein
MTLPKSTDYVTHNDLVPMYIWIGTIAKILVQQNILDRELFIRELQGIKEAGSTYELEFDLAQMIERVNSW